MKKVPSRSNPNMYSSTDRSENNKNPQLGYKIDILGVSVHFGRSLPAVIGHIMKVLNENKDTLDSFLISTVNPEFVLSAGKDKVFRNILSSSLLALPDGKGVVMAKDFLDKVKDTKNPVSNFLKGVWLGLSSFWTSSIKDEGITGVDLFYNLMKASEEKNYSVFLLGGFTKAVPNTSGLTAEKLKEKYPKLNIIGSSSVFSCEEHDDDKTLAYIKSCMETHRVKKLDILAVAYGQVKQEKWIDRNASKIPATISIGLGGTFDYISGTTPRAPYVLRRLYLEWLYRLIKEPKKRFRRVLNAFPIFPLKVFLSTLRHDKL